MHGISIGAVALAAMGLIALLAPVANRVRYAVFCALLAAACWVTGHTQGMWLMLSVAVVCGIFGQD